MILRRFLTHITGYKPKIFVYMHSTEYLHDNVITNILANYIHFNRQYKYFNTLLLQKEFQ